MTERLWPDLSPDDMCKCAALPVMRWRLHGRWIVVGDISGDGARDAERYLASGASAWQIACPTCARLYVEGTTQ